MDSDKLILVEAIIDEVSTFNIKEISADITYLRESNYNLSYPKVQNSLERVIHYLRKNKEEDIAKKLEDILIDSQRKINMHTCLIALIKELKELENLNSDILDYIYSEYQGIILSDETKMYKVKKVKRSAVSRNEASKIHSLSLDALIEKMNYKGNASVLLRENELEVTLLATLLFSSNRAYVGKIDAYLSKSDSYVLRNKLKDILESDYDNHVIQFLNHKNEVADPTYKNLEDIEKQFEMSPEESLSHGEMTSDDYEALRLSESIEREIYTNNYNDEDSSLDDEDRLDKLAHYIRQKSLNNLHTRVNYGANDALIINNEHAVEIDEVLITRYIRNSLAHYRWRFVDNGYVHLWHKDEDTGELDFNIKMPVEILRRYIKFFIEEIFRDVKYLTVDDFNGNYPNEYMDMDTLDMVDDLIKKGVILKRDKKAVLEIVKNTLDNKCAFYTEEYSRKRAAAVLKYILDNYNLIEDDKTFIEDLINEDDLDYFIDLDLRGILDWLDENEMDIDSDQIELDMEHVDLGYDLHFQNVDKNIIIMDAIREEFIVPLMIDYALIADYAKIISRINPYDSGTDLDIVPVLPFESQSRYIDEKVLVKTLITTILTILFVHTEVDEELLNDFDLTGIKLTKKGEAIFKRDFEEKEKSVAEPLEDKLKTYKDNIKKHQANLQLAEAKLEKLKRDRPDKVAKIQSQEEYINDIKEKIRKNHELIAERTVQYYQDKTRIEAAKTEAYKLYTGKQQYSAVRNSLAHGNLVIPDNLDLSNIDDTIITIVDKNPERDNELTFEGKIKLSSLLAAYCKPKIMIPTFNLDTRFYDYIDIEQYIPEATYEKRTLK